MTTNRISPQLEAYNWAIVYYRDMKEEDPGINSQTLYNQFLEFIKDNELFWYGCDKTIAKHAFKRSENDWKNGVIREYDYYEVDRAGKKIKVFLEN